VTILGPANLASTVPHDASQMYGRNIATFLKNLVKDGQLTFASRRRDHARIPGDEERRDRSPESASSAGSERLSNNEFEVSMYVLVLAVAARPGGWCAAFPPLLHTPLMH